MGNVVSDMAMVCRCYGKFVQNGGEIQGFLMALNKYELL